MIQRGHICIYVHVHESLRVCLQQLLFKALHFETLLLWLLSCQSLSAFLRL